MALRSLWKPLKSYGSEDEGADRLAEQGFLDRQDMELSISLVSDAWGEHPIARAMLFKLLSRHYRYAYELRRRKIIG